MLLSMTGYYYWSKSEEERRVAEEERRAAEQEEFERQMTMQNAGTVCPFPLS